MSEEKLTSNQLDIEEKRLSSNLCDTKETYKKISEDIGLENVSGDTVKNSNMVRENGDSVQDGADEKMLGASSDKEALALKDVEVKFISGEPNTNGDAKIEIGSVEKAFTGMTKDELMKYANDPFWVKLRWILFIAFWGLWVAMLAGAIAIIVLAPKCAAPTPLAWYQKGPLITVDGKEGDDNISKMEELKVQGVIYKLPEDQTYAIKEDEINNIKKIVEKFKDIKVIVDLAPNFVTKDDPLFKKALDGDSDAIEAFVTTTQASNWKKINKADDAFVKQGNKYFLSQFGDYFDIKLDNPIAQEKFKNVLTQLVDLGVKGFRLLNAKHLKIGEIADEKPKSDASRAPESAVGSYGFYTHKYTTYVDGLGDLIHPFTRHVHNITNDEGFLSIHEHLGENPEVFLINGTSQFAFDLPSIELESLLTSKDPSSSIAAKIYYYFANKNTTIPSLLTSWMQLQFDKNAYTNLNPSAFYMFASLLRGVQIAPLDAFTSFSAPFSEKVKDLALTREKSAIQHGSFDFFLSQNNDTFAYARIKSGNPGYFVVLNPSDENVRANFTADIIGSEMEVFMVSEGFNQNKTKYMPSNIEMPPKSTAIFTFVPK